MTKKELPIDVTPTAISGRDRHEVTAQASGEGGTWTFRVKPDRRQLRSVAGDLPRRDVAADRR